MWHPQVVGVEDEMASPQNSVSVQEASYMEEDSYTTPKGSGANSPTPGRAGEWVLIVLFVPVNVILSWPAWIGVWWYARACVRACECVPCAHTRVACVSACMSVCVWLICAGTPIEAMTPESQKAVARKAIENFADPRGDGEKTCVFCGQAPDAQGEDQSYFEMHLCRCLTCPKCWFMPQYLGLEPNHDVCGDSIGVKDCLLGHHVRPRVGEEGIAPQDAVQGGEASGSGAEQVCCRVVSLTMICGT